MNNNTNLLITKYHAFLNLSMENLNNAYRY